MSLTQLGKESRFENPTDQQLHLEEALQWIEVAEVYFNSKDKESAKIAIPNCLNEAKKIIEAYL